MTEDRLQPAAGNGHLEPAVEKLLSELQSATRLRKSCLLLAIYSSDSARLRAQGALARSLIDSQQRVAHLGIMPHKASEVAAWLAQLSEPCDVIFWVDGLRRHEGAPGQVFSTLGTQRDLFVQLGIRAIFWLNEHEAIDLAHYAPEFWARRQCVVELAEAEEPQAAHAALEANSAIDEGALLAGSIDVSALSVNGENPVKQAEVVKSHPSSPQDMKAPRPTEVAQAAPAGSPPTLDRLAKVTGAAMPKADPRAGVHTNATQSAGSRVSGEREPRELRSDDESADAWNAQGNELFRQGAVQEAIEAYNRAIQLDAAFGWPYGNLAVAYLAQAQYAEALLLYQKSLELLATDAERAVSWNGLGNVYRCLNDYPNAVAAYQKAAELDPLTAGMRDGADYLPAGQYTNSATAWNDLGEAFLKTGAHDEAIRAFKKAIDLAPARGWPYSNLGSVLAALGHHGKAVPFFQKAIDLLENNKEKAQVWNRLGNAYRRLNDYGRAIKAYQEAVSLADEGVTVLSRARFSLLGNCYADR